MLPLPGWGRAASDSAAQVRVRQDGQGQALRGGGRGVRGGEEGEAIHCRGLGCQNR